MYFQIPRRLFSSFLKSSRIVHNKGSSEISASCLNWQAVHISSRSVLAMWLWTSKEPVLLRRSFVQLITAHVYLAKPLHPTITTYAPIMLSLLTLLIRSHCLYHRCSVFKNSPFPLVYSVTYHHSTTFQFLVTRLYMPVLTCEIYRPVSHLALPILSSHHSHHSTALLVGRLG